ncbi:MAG: DUF4340 domain-containing protein [Roseibacillus sp.]|nr:DUF4340 domain-containing protein [Roseibacillus sp.]
MKNTRLLFLVGVTAISTIMAMLMLLNTPERFSPNNEQIGEYLVTSFSEDSVEEIRIKDSENEVALRKNGSDWVVANRQDYPIDNPGEVQQLLRSLAQFKIGLEVPAEPEHHAQIGLLAPGNKEEAEAYQEERKKAGETNPGDPRGLHISVTAKGGKPLVDLILGEEFGEIASRAPRGFVVRSSASHPGIWKALGTLNRSTGDAESQSTDKRRGQLSNPASWLSYKFVEIEKIKSITLSAPNDEEFKGWTVNRTDENGDFSTGDLKDDEEMDTAGTGSFKTLFNKLRFEDVLDSAEAEKKKDPAKSRQAVITTFDGFTYTFELSPVKEEEKAESDTGAPPPPSSNYIGTVKVEANLLAERIKSEGETPEDAANAEKLFQAKRENLEYKLELEKVFANRVYEFANFSVSSLDKGRDEIVKKKEEPEENAAPNAAGTKPRATAVSPPVAIPPRPSATTPPIPVPTPKEGDEQ